MAEGWAKHLRRDCMEVWSAGTSPQGVNPLAIQVMKEVGVDLTSHRSKHIDELRGIDFDFVVTVCGRANDACPQFPGRATRIHVGFDDPPALARSADSTAHALEIYRRVRDEIRSFVESLPERLNKESDQR